MSYNVANKITTTDAQNAAKEGIEQPSDRKHTREAVDEEQYEQGEQMKFKVRITAVQSDDFTTFVEAGDEDEVEEKVRVALSGCSPDIGALKIDGQIVPVEHTYGEFDFEIEILEVD